MRSEDEQPAIRKVGDRFYIVSGDEMNRIIVSLTVVHAYVQLLRRRIGQGQVTDPGELADALATMEAATRAMSADLWSIMQATSPLKDEAD